MPNLAANHPQVIHFVIGLLFMGVAFRLVSLTKWLPWTKHSATVLLLAGAVAAAVAVKSGVDAHGPVERIPGVRDLVIHHEEEGIETRNLFLGVAGLELLALGLAAGAATARFSRFAYMASALVGLFGLTVLYETSELGGELVYEYAGGPGLRTGDPQDAERLLIAGLYTQGMADRRANRPDEAARLFAELAVRAPGDTTARFLAAESILLDRKDPARALVALRAIEVDPAVARFATRKASLTADAFLALGLPDSARAALQPVVAAFPQNTRLKAKLDSIK